MRIRSLKPGFFHNEDLCAFTAFHRLAFAGLWLCADREGRLEDRPKRLHAKIFPYDHDLDFDALLWDLAMEAFIRRYKATNERRYIDIPSWNHHQFPRQDERPSELPEFEAGQSLTGFSALEPGIVVVPVKTAPEVVAAIGVIKTVTEASLRSHAEVTAPTTPQQMGSGILGLGNGVLGVGVTLPSPNARSKHPVFRGNRLIVFDWQLEDCEHLLGPHLAGFELDVFFDTLDRRCLKEHLVPPTRDHGDWLKAELLAEAQRRGLPLRTATTSSAPQFGKLTTRLAQAIANIKAEAEGT